MKALPFIARDINLDWLENQSQYAGFDEMQTEIADTTHSIYTTVLRIGLAFAVVAILLMCIGMYFRSRRALDEAKTQLLNITTGLVLIVCAASIVFGIVGMLR